MSSNTTSRFEELDAGRALGDLSPEEVEEWEALAREGAMDQTIDFDLLATELEPSYVSDTLFHFFFISYTGSTRVINNYFIILSWTFYNRMGM